MIKTRLSCALWCWIIEPPVGCWWRRAPSRRFSIGLPTADILQTCLSRVLWVVFFFFLSLSVVTQPHLNSFHYSLWHFTQPLGVSQSQQQRACFSFHAEATVTSTSVWRATSTDHPGELGDWLLVELHRRLSREENHHQSSTKTPRRALRPAGFDRLSCPLTLSSTSFCLHPN